jgi:hypothetical protein
MADKGKKYGLAHKDTSFHDFETDFDLVRDQVKELGEKVGSATRRAIREGRLVEAAAKDDDKEKK